ncbi:MAG: BrnT family toxin [Nitrospirae bacterium]|nr:BrnT family toxin [Nitrospirota bacterium]
MRFEWDPEKAAGNFAKHGLSFEKAITAFDDPYALIAPDPGHSTPAEVREWLIGQSDSSIVVVVFTVIQLGNVYRIISARKAIRKERRRYEET